MLVLSRRKSEKIMIGDNIEIMVVQIGWRKVRLGITAPREIAVDRKEIYIKKKREKQNGQSTD